MGRVRRLKEHGKSGPAMRPGALSYVASRLPFTTPKAVPLFFASIIVAVLLLISTLHEIFHANSVELFADDVYDKAESVINELEKSDIAYYLGYGTALGAARFGGILRHDYDIDIYTVDASEYEIETVLEQCKELGLIEQWFYQNDGLGPGDIGFGYHLSFANSDFYTDIWVMAEKDSTIQCVGRGGGCVRWLRKHESKNEWHDMHIPHDHIFPVRKLPFGTKSFNFPNKMKKYLDLRFPSWMKVCGGWTLMRERRCKKEEVAFYRATYENHLELLGA